jgi:hypothetical protein
MRVPRFSAVLLSVIIFTVSAMAGDSREPSVSIAVENVSLASATTERLQLNASISLMSTRKVALNEVVFGQLNASGVPFYAAAVSERLVLLPNQKVLPPKPLLLTVYLRDLNNLKPLRALVEDGKVTITGIAYARVDLTEAEKLFLRTGHVRVPMKIDSSVELHIPGGIIAKIAALALIDHVQQGLESTGSVWQSAAKLFSERRQSIWNDYAPALVLAHATYLLRDGAGATFPFESTAMGFRVNGHQVILPKSVLEPWKFDPYVAASMKEDGSLKVSGYDLSLWPAKARLRDDAGQLSADQAWSLSAHQIRILPLTKDDTEPMLLTDNGKVVKIRVHSRQSAAALGLVEITDPSVAPMSPVLAVSGNLPSPKGASGGGDLAIFRFPEGIDTRQANPGIMLVSARPGVATLELDSPIDSSGWGSPVISQQGIIGVVSGENSMIPIADAAKALNFSTVTGGEH